MRVAKASAESSPLPAKRQSYTRIAQLFGTVPDSGDAPPEASASSRPATYRSLCVRLCDGYYFPISFATPRALLARDARACESRCGSEARLFVYPNPGGDVPDMRDLDGVPYSKLPTAFLYRTKYMPSCTCQPHPWQAEALQRHRRYALMAAARAGSKDAARQLQAMPAGKLPVREVAGDGRSKRGRGAKAKLVASADDSWDEDGMMHLGHKHGRRAFHPRQEQTDRAWRRQAFQAN